MSGAESSVECGYGGPWGLFPVPYGREVFQYHWFNFWNSISYQIIAGPPVVLLAKELGAGSLLLGIIASFQPLMIILQIPAAKRLGNRGYRSFALAGWTTRTLFITLAALVPSMVLFERGTRLALLTLALFFFSLVRGFSSAAFLPWITGIVPATQRGRFLAVDQSFLNAGFLAAMVVSAVMLAGHVESWRYSLVLGISLVSALVGLFFLARVPDTAHVEYDGEQHPAHPVSLRVMIAHAPFRNFILFGFLVAAMSGGLGVFPVEYQRVGAGFTPSVISALSAAIFLGPILVLRYFGRSVDRAGGIPVMRNAMACFSFILLLWTLICAGIIPPSYGWVLVLNMTGGASLAVFSMASGHLLMELVPMRGKNHYFAMATVAGNLGLSLSPVIWGWLLERMHRLDLFLGPFHVTKYSVYFAGITLLAITAVPGCMILKNAEAFRKQGQ